MSTANTTSAIAQTKARKRCAVYCRVSSDERLEQEFNSVDAQKESGHAYVASQRSEGWIPVADDYDDPGFSGGNTERPGLKRLMADIARGLVDIVVVYKIDRLTRSLADFSKMVEVFERHSVSFVSVTQQFNTTTSMGRLMLNVLLSFAQFEREVTGERIRDKIAASKRKGLWMGGVPPLGYDVQSRLLVINETEAAVVRRIFADMLTVGSPTKIGRTLTLEGITTKAWTTQDGQVRAGAQIDKKFLHKLLRNRIYLGELSHKGSWFPGAHPAIIDHGLWGQVHEVLAKDPHARAGATQIRSRTDSLLRGLLFAPSGDPMYATYTRKNGRKYHYYMSKSESRFGALGKTSERMPAAEVEAATVAQIKAVLSSPESIVAVCRQVQNAGSQVDEVTTVMAMVKLGDVWEQLFPTERHRIVNLMIERIDLVSGGLKVKWRALGWKALIGEFTPVSIGAELVEAEGLSMNDGLETFVPMTLARRGVQQLATTDAPAFDATILHGLGRAFYWKHLLDTGVARSGSDIARQEGLHHSCINELMRLTLLAPDIIAQLMAGRQPRRLTLMWFQRNPLPVDWQAQRDIIASFK